MIGRTLGHYRIEAKLGAGGMGVVYKAQDMHLSRPVAIKVLSPEAVSDPERKRRFVQEAHTASALNHPNILHIYDIDEADGVDFIAMEYVAGETLDRLVGGRGISAAETVNYACQIAGALARAHDAGIVHRDIKPANIIVTPEGLVKVLDFGLAKLTEPAPAVAESDLTQTVQAQTEAGLVMGTVEYMAPEQAEGKKVDARSDIFALGAVLYEMLCGRRPFQGDSKLAILAAVLNKEPKPLREIRAGVPAPLDRIVSRCLQKDPARRFQSMDELKAALDRVQERLRQPPAAERRFSVRPWWRRAAIAVAAIGLVVAAALAWRGVHGESQGGLVAVLPFQSAAADPAGQAMLDGLGETLSREIGWLNQFQPARRVVPPHDVHGDAALGAANARRLLGVDLVLAGSLQQTASQVRWTMSLVATNPVREVQHLKIEAPLRDISARQRIWAGKAAKLLGFHLTGQAEALLATGITNIPEAYDAYLQAYGYLGHADRAGSVDRAISLFQAAIDKDPSYGRAYAGLGEALCAKSLATRDQQWAEKARESCLRAIALHADLPDVHLALGKIYAGTGRPQEAVNEFRQALQLDPLSIAAYTGLGGAYQALGRLDDSENTYKALITLWPNYIVPYSYLGSFYVQQGRYREAEPAFRKYVELAPDNHMGYQNLGAVDHFLGRTDDAEAMMKKSLAIKPTAWGYTNLGSLYFFEGRYSDAVPLMEKAAEMDPTNYIYWGNLGDAYRWAPEYKAHAREAYTRAIALAGQQAGVNPNDAGLRASLAGYYAKLPEAAKALAEIAWARRLAPMNPAVLFKAAMVYEIIGRRNQALSALDLAFEGGYSIDEARREPELVELRKDPRYGRLDARASTRSARLQGLSAQR
ncbi:MAG TPA: protein kinase [Bryobacteraceae bacterium]|nr:protein kinase [Bryobacteraceae bacterium]